MSNAEMWALLVGFLAPNLIAFVQRPGWSDRARAIVMAVSSLVIGGATAWFNGEFDGVADVTRIVLLVAMAAMTSYKTLWKPLGVATAIEHVTTPAGHYRKYALVA